MSDNDDLDALPDSLILELTVYGEARGQGPEEWAAVAWAIRNRVETDLHNDNKPDWWGEGFRGVCLKPKQFSCWNKGDPNRAKMLALPATDPLLERIRIVVERVMVSEILDPTGGATHYHTVNTDPDWDDNMEETYRTRSHVFYRGS